MSSLEAAQRNYEENLKRIPWNAADEKSSQEQFNRMNAQVNTNLPNYVNLTESEIRGMDGVAARRRVARSAVDNGLNALNALNANIGGRVNNFDIGGIQNRIRVVEDQLKSERGKQKKSSEILAIRREQSESLEKKYNANLHSSWLGLWRPLKDSTHVGLNVASTMFGLLALLTIGVMVYARIVAPAAATAGGASASSSSSSSSNLLRGLMGGFRKARAHIGR
jgi:hypothetical protein